MPAVFRDPVARLFLRALLAAAIAFATKFVDSGGHLSYTSAGLHAAIVAAGLSFAEVFTPLNGIVGAFKTQPALSEPVNPPAA